MRVHSPTLAVLVVGSLFIGSRASLAQEAPSLDRNSPFLGGVPTGQATAGALPLSIKDAIARGLEHNLGVLLQEEGVETARGSRWQSLTGLLPEVSARVGEARRKSSLAEFGFTSFPGLTSRTVGPFNVFDTRLSVTQALVDVSAVYEARAGAAGVEAAKFEVANARDLVVLVVANLYLETLADTARVETARAALATADTLFTLATDLKNAGIAAGVDTLRAQVQQQTERQRVIAAENQLAKTKLSLARAVGLPLGQEVALTDGMPDLPLPPDLTVDKAMALAYQWRGDYLAAQAQVKAAEAAQHAAKASLLPSLQVSGDVGRVGTTTSSTDFVYGIAGAVVVPVFQRGRQQARLAQSGAELARRRALADDMRARVDLEVRSAFLDVDAARQALEAATTGLSLAREQLAQSRDRFSSGVTGTVEVVQAQEAVAAASESHTAALYSFNLAKAMLARAMGRAEEAAQTYFGGSRQ